MNCEHCDKLEQLSAAIEHHMETNRSLLDQRKHLLECAQSLSKGLTAADKCLNEIKDLLMRNTDAVAVDTIKRIDEVLDVWEKGGEQ